MSDKAGPSEGAPLDGDAGKHGNALVEGVGTAISWLTIIPMRGARVFDRITGRRAIAALPVAGLVPGVAAVLLVWLTLTVVPLSDAGSAAIGSTAGSGAGVAGPSHPLLPLLVGVLIVCLAEWLTRGMHLDGLADVADALGSYRGPEDARKVLADPATGPMGVGAVALTLMVQSSAFGVMASHAFAANGPVPHVSGETGIFAGLVGGTGGGADAAASGIVPDFLLGGPFPPLGGAILVFALPFIFARAAAMTACHRSFPRMSDSGFGSLTAGTQSGWSVALWWLVLASLGFVTAGISGVVAAVAAAGFAWLFTRRVVKRLDGVNGDALGAIVQVATALTAVVLALG